MNKTRRRKARARRRHGPLEIMLPPGPIYLGSMVRIRGGLFLNERGEVDSYAEIVLPYREA